jgi:hypothetical protein
MAFDKPSEDDASTAPKRQFCGLEMKVHSAPLNQTTINRFGDTY